MPSASSSPPVPQGPGLWRKASRLGAIVAFCCLLVVGLAWGALQMLGSSSFVSDRLKASVDSTLRQVIGPDVASAAGPARLTLDGGNLVAVDFDDVNLARRRGESAFLEARQLSFGLRAWPLLLGRVELASANVEGARIAVDGWSQGGGDWAAGLRDERGLIQPDKAVAAAFAGLDGFVRAVRSGSTREISLNDVTLEAAALDGHTLVISHAVLADDGEAVSVTGRAVLDGVAYNLDGRIDPEAQGSDVRSFAVTLAPDSAAAGEPRISLGGQQASGSGPAQLKLGITTMNRDLDLGAKNGVLRGDVELVASLTAGAGKVEIEKLTLLSGQSRFQFDGAVGPSPPDAAGTAPPSYRYELISNNSVIAPRDSTEQPLPASVLLSGIYLPDARRLAVERLAVRASSGEVTGKGAIQLADRKSPGLSLEIGLNGMAVEQVKQLWPWIAAGSARRWTMANLFDGKVSEGTVRYNVPVGRLGDGGRLTADEVSGRFVIEDSRFDIAGTLPPIRDAYGEIAFAGSDVVIKLARGNAFMSSGRSVAASNGTLNINDIGGPNPLIGKMEMDVAGNADAIAELASYEPIAVLQRTGFDAADFSGTVSGHIVSDIPLRAGIDRASLDWSVRLQFDNLDLADPIQGQKVSDADGTITIDPKQVAIKAQGRMNAIPAEFDIVRPLGNSGVAVRQDVELIVDDKTRTALAPGLNAIISGPIRLKVDGRSGGAPGNQVDADLRAAKLMLPWIGWSKGAGIPATAKFTFSGGSGSQQISGFTLSGQSFSVRGGAMSVAGGTLQSARFDHVSLYGDDDMSVGLKRAGKGMNITVRASRIDGRSIIKSVNESGAGSGGSGAGPAISVDADIDQLAGFGNETLSSVKLLYSGAGSRMGSINLDGVTDTGAAVSISNASSGGQRNMKVSSGDAGALLRFMNVYGRMQGGRLQLSLSGGDTLSGQVDVRDFAVVDEPKLRSLVSSRPAGNGRSLSEAVKTEIDVSKVKFDRGYARLAKSDDSLRIDNGVLRGPSIGTTFEGTVYDGNGRIDMSGTFMPAYALNSMFGDIPVLGAFLGNGKDGGLIGLTYRLRGNAKAPTLEVNPLSVIAPGIFRSIFEF